jgi:hypothetical protein
MRVRSVVSASVLAIVGFACKGDPQMVQYGIESGLYVGQPAPIVALAQGLCGEAVKQLELDATTVKVSDVNPDTETGTATLTITRPNRQCSGRIGYKWTSTAKWVQQTRAQGHMTTDYIAYDFAVLK